MYPLTHEDTKKTISATLVIPKEKLYKYFVKYSSMEMKAVYCPPEGDICSIESNQKLSPLSVDLFVWEERSFILKKHIFINREFRNGLWVFEHQGLRLHAYAASYNDALHELNEHFAVIWDGIAEENDNSLTKDALKLKKQLRKLVANIETA